MTGTDTPNAEADTPSRRGTNRLTPREIEGWLSRLRSGKPRKGDPSMKLSDGDGMYLMVTPAGTPVWRVKYRHGGKEGVYAIGTLQEFSLAQARAERDKVRGDLREGRDPIQARDTRQKTNVDASEQTFEAVARDWLRKQKKQWSAIHYDKSERALERDVFPEVGKLPVRDIRPAMVSKIIEDIAHRGAIDTAGKVRQHIGGIFRLAQAKGLCDYKENPADPAREIIPKKPKLRRRPAFLKWTELGDVLRKGETAHLSPVVRLAHRLLAFSSARISNVVQAEWKEFSLEADPPLWVIPRKKMKSQDREHDHKVILGPTIAAELREWRGLGKGKGFVFPSPAGGDHISREALEKAYRVTMKLEGKHTPHGWRSALSTLARDKGEEKDKAGKVISPAFERDVVELALDHIHDNAVVRAYDRGERLEQRIRLMTWWDGELSRAERGADVLPIGAKAAK